MDWRGTHLLITGGSSGIGAGIADQAAGGVATVTLVAGIEKGTPEIYADPTTRLLARTVSTTPGLYRRHFDRIVAKVSRR